MQSLTSFTANDLQEALNTLKTTSGIFSRIDNAFGDLTCYDTDGDMVIAFNQSGGTWIVTPYLNNTTPATGSHQLSEVTFSEGYLCEQGLYLITATVSNLRRHLIITKGSNGKCCVIIAQESGNFSITSPPNFYVTTKSDDTSLYLYINGIRSPGYFASSPTAVADRTILEKIPIVGSRGSNDYASGCFTVFMRQFQDQGNVIIDGKKYYCAYRFAILDE